MKKNILIDSKLSNSSLTRVKYSIIAYMYYAAVRLFGGKHFNYIRDTNDKQDKG